MTRANSQFREASQRIIDAAAWALPLIAIVDLVGLRSSSGWASRLAWSGWLVVTAIAVYQRQTRRHDLRLLIGTGMLWIGIGSILSVVGPLEGSRDSASDLVALVVLSLILVSLTPGDPARLALIAGSSLLAWVSTVAVSEGADARTTLFRGAVVAASFGAASMIAVHVRKDLRADRAGALRAIDLHEAMAQCARDLLEGGGSEHLEHAFEVVLAATSATSVFVEVNVDDPELGPCSSMLWEFGQDVSPPDHWALVPWSEQPSAYAHLSQGKPFVFSVNDLEGVERSRYDALDDYSEADYPIFVDGQWVGSVGFGYIEMPLQPEYHALGAVAEMIGAHWKRNAEQAGLEQSIADRTSLVAAVSHELRTPLTGVLGLSSELAERADLPEEERCAMARLISEQASDMTAIVEDLLVAARPDPQISLDVGRVSLTDLAVGVVKTMGESIDVGGVCVDVKADQGRVRQIARNLITNARRYGGPTITVLTGVVDSSGFLEVRDDGIGVESVNAERIFDPYERAHPAVVHPGSVGLGLAVSRRLARLMGGDLVYLRSGGETTFRLTLPINSSDQSGSW